MALISISIQFLISVVFSFGQLARITIHSLDIPILDPLLVIFALIQIPKLVNQYQNRRLNLHYLSFIIIAWLTLFVNVIFFGIQLRPWLYLVRLTSLIILLLTARPYRHFPLFIIVTIIFGFIQYIIWPDFTPFGALEWDPHLYRLVSVFFDPTFTGIIFLFFFYKVFLSTINLLPKQLLLFTTYLAISLTYSRATLLSLIVGFIYIGVKTKRYILIPTSFTVVAFTLVLLPRMPGEGTKLERISSIRAKIENYRQGLSLFGKSPLFGYGYNNLALIRLDTKPASHSANGFDSSLLTILVTCGLLGIVPFLTGGYLFFQQQNLLRQTILISLLFHSLFANSLLYPWVIIAVCFL